MATGGTDKEVRGLGDGTMQWIPPFALVNESGTTIFSVTEAGAGVNAGTQYIGDTANADVTLGLTINQGTADDQILALKSSDVAHGLTTLAETDTYLSVAKVSATLGGALVSALSDGDGSGLIIRGVIGANNPTDTVPAVAFRAGKSNGTTGIADVAAAETAFQFGDSDNTDKYLTILGDGKVGIGQVAPTSLLHVVGTTNLAGAVTVTAADVSLTNGNVVVSADAANGKGIVLGPTATPASIVYAASGNIEVTPRSSFNLSLTAGNLILATGDLIITAPTTPASASATGTIGTIAWDTGFLYVCTATDTWERVAIATW